MGAFENFYGHGYRLHPVTRRPLEQGIGHRSDEEQAELHIQEIEATDKLLADALRAEMKAIRNKAIADHELAMAEHKE